MPIVRIAGEFFELDYSGGLGLVRHIFSIFIEEYSTFHVLALALQLENIHKPKIAFTLWLSNLYFLTIDIFYEATSDNCGTEI